MNRQIAMAVLLLLLSILSLISCHRQIPLEGEAIHIQQVNDLVRSAIKRLGENRSSVQSILGAPNATSTEQLANPHVREQIDQIHTLVYNGLVVRIYEASSFKKEMLLSVRLTENHPSVLPELIGFNKKSIEAEFGDPSRVNGAVFEYIPVYNSEEPGEDVVKIEFSNSTVSAVEWDYYVD